MLSTTRNTASSPPIHSATRCRFFLRVAGHRRLASTLPDDNPHHGVHAMLITSYRAPESIEEFQQMLRLFLADAFAEQVLVNLGETDESLEVDFHGSHASFIVTIEDDEAYAKRTRPEKPGDGENGEDDEDDEDDDNDDDGPPITFSTSVN
jgi:hypothetical protein